MVKIVTPTGETNAPLSKDSKSLSALLLAPFACGAGVSQACKRFVRAA
jgi:hypothetical protein